MRVAIASAFRPGYDVGLDSAYARAFRALGHETIPISSVPKASITGGRIQARVATVLGNERHQRALDRAVREANPDLVVLVKGQGLTGRTVARWRADGMRIINIFPDNPFEAAAQGFPSHELLKQFDATDVVFVPDRFSAGQLRRRGVRAEFLAFARDPGAHGIDPTDELDAGAPPLVFIGNPDAERIRYLRAVADLGLRVYGAWHWAKLAPDDPLARCVAGGVQLGAEMVHHMRSAKLSINVLRQSQKTAHNMRTFEIPACGVCCLSEATVAVEELMAADREVILFRTPEELRARVVALLDAPAQIDEVARQGLERVRDDTYERRAAEILACVGLA